MTDRELLQQALDMLDDINQCSLPPTGIPLPAEIDHVMEALRARLTQPEPWVKTYSGGKPNYTQPIEQEPVAWGVDEGEGRCISLHDLYFVKEDADHMAELKGTHAKVVALYTAPPKKEWVGLTDEDMRKLRYLVDWTAPLNIAALATVIEAQLKEKNT